MPELDPLRDAFLLALVGDLGRSWQRMDTLAALVVKHPPNARLLRRHMATVEDQWDRSIRVLASERDITPAQIEAAGVRLSLPGDVINLLLADRRAERLKLGYLPEDPDHGHA